MITFEKRKVKIKVVNPENSSESEQELEFRKDPLTSRWCRVNINRARRSHINSDSNDEFLKEIIEKSKINCPLCKEFSSVYCDFGKIKKKMKFGQSFLTPNKFPYSAHHVIGILSDKHFLGLNELSPRILYDSLMNSIEFFKIVNENSPDSKYPSINFNFMPPSAASLIHPHFQIILDDKPTFFTSLLIEKSLDYYKNNNSNFWHDLVKEERKNEERFIGETGSFSWLADFSALKNNQVSGIILDKISSITNMKEKNVKDLSNGLSKIFEKSWNKGVRSLNMSIFSGPMNEDISDYFVVNLKIVSRPTFTPNYITDIGHMELLHQESILENLPEDVAKQSKF